MSSVPSFENSCIAPAATAPSEVWLVGVSESNPGRLDAYIVNLADINTPSARFIAAQVDNLRWSRLAQKGCYPFSNTMNDPNSPVLLQQFGSKSYTTNVYPNGTVAEGTDFVNYTFVSPSMFSLSPAVDGFNWYNAFSDQRSTATNSRWMGVRWRSTWSLVSRGTFDTILSVYPTDRPLLSVGTFEPKAGGTGSGYHTVFDSDGSGMAYSAVASSAPYNQSGDRILTLANPQKVDMSGITLTVRAIPVTMNNVGYILDGVSDATTVVYSINPSKELKLRRVDALSDVAPFSSSMVASYMNTQIVVYTPSVKGKAIFNTFDTVTRKWSGPGLVKSQLTVSNDPDDTSNKTPIGAIIGGTVGGLVVIAVAVFLIIRHRRKTRSPGSLTEKVDVDDNNAGTTPTQQGQQEQPQSTQLPPQGLYRERPKVHQPQLLPQLLPQLQPQHEPEEFLHTSRRIKYDPRLFPPQHPHAIMYPDESFTLPSTLEPAAGQPCDNRPNVDVSDCPAYKKATYSTSQQHPHSYFP